MVCFSSPKSVFFATKPARVLCRSRFPLSPSFILQFFFGPKEPFLLRHEHITSAKLLRVNSSGGRSFDLEITMEDDPKKPLVVC